MSKKYSVNINTIIAFLIFFSFIEISYLREFKYFQIIMWISKALVICIMFMHVIKKIINKTIKLSKISLIFIICQLEILAVTIIYNFENIFSCIKYLLPLILLCIYFENIEVTKYNYYFNVFSNMTFIYVILNLISVILYPNGMYGGIQNNENYYLLGHNNAIIRKLSPGVMISGFCDYINFNKFNMKTKIMALLLLVTVILTWSNVSMTCIALFIVYIFFLYKFNINKIISSKLLFLIPIVIFLIIIAYNRFFYIFEAIGNLFGKDATLTGRTVIWETGFNLIKSKLLFGYGYGNIIDVVFRDSNNLIFRITSFHNYFIDLLYQGGVVHFIIFLIWLFKICDIINKDENKIGQYIKICLLMIFILWTALPCNNNDSLFLLILMCIFANYKQISKCMIEQQKIK